MSRRDWPVRVLIASQRRKVSLNGKERGGKSFPYRAGKVPGAKVRAFHLSQVVTIPLLFDFIKSFARGIRSENCSDQKAENHKANHDCRSAREIPIAVDAGKNDIPDSKDQPCGEEGDPLREGTVPCRIKFAVPELIERLLT